MSFDSADVVIADLRDMDVRETVHTLTGNKSEGTQIILLAEREQIPILTERMPSVQDIWAVPAGEEEIRFRFLRWQQTYKTGRDYWQSNHFLEATINNVPNLIWYKDKDGVHEKVNDSFCVTVGKTRQQVEGKRHAYIWDVEEDDPACIESEREVMSSEKTCVSEERVKTGDGTRLLKTYKSPLYDIDGSVMGTVGVAIDVTQERAYEQEIIQKNRTLETIFNNIDCGVMYHSVDGAHIISVNQAALDILGYGSVDEIMADGFDMVAASVVEEDREELLECIRGLKEEGDSVSLEYRVRRKEGEIRYVMGNVKLMRENDELRYQRFLLDCTARKLQEEENARYQTELIHALCVDYKLVCFFDLETGEGKPLRFDNETICLKIYWKGICLMRSVWTSIRAITSVKRTARRLRQPFPEKGSVRNWPGETSIMSISASSGTISPSIISLKWSVQGSEQKAGALSWVSGAWIKRSVMRWSREVC